jgi:hypothetical protein
MYKDLSSLHSMMLVSILMQNWWLVKTLEMWIGDKEIGST